MFLGKTFWTTTNDHPVLGIVEAVEILKVFLVLEVEVVIDGDNDFELIEEHELDEVYLLKLVQQTQMFGAKLLNK